MLDHGGWRRATLQGCENQTKRHQIAALSFNLSLLMRTLFVSGIAKRRLAAPLEISLRSIRVIDRPLENLLGTLGVYLRALIPIINADAGRESWQFQNSVFRANSTGYWQVVLKRTTSSKARISKAKDVAANMFTKTMAPCQWRRRCISSKSLNKWTGFSNP